MSAINGNPFIGRITHNFDEMKRISDASKPYEYTGEQVWWQDVETKQEIYTNL